MIILFLILLILIIINNKEYFTHNIEFKNINGSIIKTFDIDKILNLSINEIYNLFKLNNEIYINIPENYSADIIYNYNIITLNSGQHKINKYYNNNIINQINIIKEEISKNDNENKIIYSYQNIPYYTNQSYSDFISRLVPFSIFPYKQGTYRN